MRPFPPLPPCLAHPPNQRRSVHLHPIVAEGYPTLLSASVVCWTLQVSEVPAGCWALVEGVEGSLVKTGTITCVAGSDDVCIFRPLAFDSASVMKIAAEPLHPSELPKMLEGLRKLNKAYPLLNTKVRANYRASTLRERSETWKGDRARAKAHNVEDRAPHAPVASKRGGKLHVNRARRCQQERKGHVGRPRPAGTFIC